MTRLNKIIADSFIEDLKKQDKKMISGVKIIIDYYNISDLNYKGFKDTCFKRNKIKKVSIPDISKDNLPKF